MVPLSFSAAFESSMSIAHDLFAHWPYRIPDLILAVLVYALLARLVLSWLLDGGNLAMRAVSALTDPVVGAVGIVTPRLVPPRLAMVAAILWLLAARLLLHQVAMAMTLRRMMQ
jgi:YggT family protein